MDAVNIAIAKKPRGSLNISYSNDKYNYRYTISAIYRDRSKKGSLEIPSQETS